MSFVPFNTSTEDSGVNRNEVNAQNSNKSLIFPQDMQKEFYPEAIKFSIYERHGVEYNEVKKLVKDAFSTSGAYIEADSEIALSKDEIKRLETKLAGIKIPDKEGDEKEAAETAQKIETQQNRLNFNEIEKLETANSTKIIGNKILGKFSEAREDQKLEKTLERHLQSIYLAMPESVNFAEGIDWQGSDLGVVGGLKSGALGFNEESMDYGVLTGGGAALGGAAGLGASLIPGISGIAGTVVGAVLGGSGLQSGIESTFGVKTNPFKEQTFQGVGFRPFDFSFNFRARSQSDVYVIQDIIRAFRSYSKPTFKEGSGGSIFKYPKEFRIEFLTIDDNNSYITNKHLPEIKFCICTAINTNFTAQGWKSFEGGAPTDITLQMTFQETEIVTGEDVSGNTKNGRFAGYKGKF